MKGGQSSPNKSLAACPRKVESPVVSSYYDRSLVKRSIRDNGTYVVAGIYRIESLFGLYALWSVLYYRDLLH
jgi:hypothetical protein